MVKFVADLNNMSDINQKLIEFLKNNYTEENILKEIQKNSLQYILSDLVSSNTLQCIAHRLRYRNHQKELLCIVSEFNQRDVPYIVFKGIVLGKQLYNDPLVRNAGDIDVFVNEQYFKEALYILFDLGYQYKDSNSKNNKHHIELVRDSIVVELHHDFFTPIFGLSTKYLQEHNMQIVIDNQSVTTLDVTATFLHLLYHLYMDQRFTTENNSNYLFFVNGSYKVKAKRFLFRAYEISLYVELFGNEIKWQDIIQDIFMQNLTIDFNHVICKIQEIFGEIFPKQFVEALNQKSWTISTNGAINEYMSWRDTAESINLSDFILSTRKNFQCLHYSQEIEINDSSEIILNPYGTYIIGGEHIHAPNEISYKLKVDTVKEGLTLTITICDTDLLPWHNALQFKSDSDNISIILVSLNQYSFVHYTIYFVKTDSGIEARVFDCIKNSWIINANCQLEFFGSKWVCYLFVPNSLFDSTREILLFNIIFCHHDKNLNKTSFSLCGERANWFDPREFIQLTN